MPNRQSSQIHLDRPKFLGAERMRNTPCGLEFNGMSLAVIERKAVALEPPVSGDSETSRRVESAAQKADGSSASVVLHS